MKNNIYANEKSLIFQTSQCFLGRDVNRLETTLINGRRAFLVGSVITATMFGGVGVANAAIVSPCSGVSLAPSVITNIIGTTVLPITGSLDGILGLLLQPVGVNSNLTNTLAGIAAGDPINLNILDSSGNIISPADQECQSTADGYSLETPKGISIGGNQITGLGDDVVGETANAGEIDSIAFGNSASTDVLATNSIAIGTNADIGEFGANSIALGAETNVDAADSIAIGTNASIGALGEDSIALGTNANVNVANSVAIGSGSTAIVGAETYTPFALTAPQTSVGEVSVGAIGAERTITNVAGGIRPTDAVNVSQLQAVSDNSVQYDAGSLRMTVTLSGVGGTKITNLAPGEVSATSTDAVNGAQLFNLTTGFTTNIDALGNSTAANLGGGASYDPLTGIVSSPTYNVYGTPQTNVGDAITALQTGLPVRYSDSSGNVTNIPSNDVTLVGSTPDPVRIHNVAAGVAATDAVNMSQLAAVSGEVALAVKYDDASLSTITLGDGTTPTLITNLQQGEISEFSTDAINGAQMFTMQEMITNITNGTTGIKYFQVESTRSDSSATGTDSIAIGPEALASGVGSIAMGLNSRATEDGAIAIGQNSESSGENAIAIGNGALATGSVAVGNNAQAGNGGAAFGDDAIALAPQQGTAIGNAAVVTSDRGVALGAGSTATRGGMNGATERFSNVSVGSTEGAVSVGDVGAERQITNVAGGTADTDAVNVRQLDAAVAQSSIETHNRLNALQSDISSVKYDSNAGTASAMAMASMPQSVIPGKVMMAAGVANYQGQSAMSVGISNFSENGRWVVNFNGTANTRGNAGAAVGVGFHW